MIVVKIDAIKNFILDKTGFQRIKGDESCVYELKGYLRTPSTHSSMKVKDRVCNPSPHISNLSVDVRVFLQKAAGAFSLPPAKFDVFYEFE